MDIFESLKDKLPKGRDFFKFRKGSKRVLGCKPKSTKSMKSQKLNADRLHSHLY